MPYRRTNDGKMLGSHVSGMASLGRRHDETIVEATDFSAPDRTYSGPKVSKNLDGRQTWATGIRSRPIRNAPKSAAVRGSPQER